MKRIVISCLLLLVALSSGCKNTYSVKTKIHSDGSFEKTIVCDGDSLGIYKLSLPYVFSDGWKIVTEKKTEGDKKFITTATKRYQSIDELQSELTKGMSSSTLRVESHIDKHFRWFFTYYTYTDTIPAYGRFKQAVPFESVFSPGEIKEMKDGKDSLVKKRVDEYWLRNIVEEFIDRLIVRSQELNDPALAPARWQEKRHILAEQIIKQEVSKTEDFTALLETTLQTRSAKKLTKAIDTTLAEVMEKVKQENDLETNFTNEVVMPGILITSNSPNVEGSRLIWDCHPNQFFDTVMTAESRMLNLWAVIVTSAVGLALVAGLLIPVFRMKSVRPDRTPFF
ncbi:MAG TPA: hypothetical protein VK470_12385 [Bacteroidota bacterium]|nr:hypothetical protein [Bacteroidota bacterium]